MGDVSVGLIAERLSLTLQPGGTSRDQIEDVVRRLGFGIAARGQEEGMGFLCDGWPRVSLRPQSRHEANRRPLPLGGQRHRTGKPEGRAAGNGRERKE